MNNQYPKVAFYFSLSFINDDGDSIASFQEVSGIFETKKSDEAESKSEALPTNPAFNNLILKRGVILYDTPLYQWCAGTFQDGLGEPVKPRTIYISLLDENANVLKTWKAINAWPVKITISELSHAEQEIAVESLEFAFSSLESE